MNLNLFGPPRDEEDDVYEDADERIDIFVELRFKKAFEKGVSDAKLECGEVGRAAGQVRRALKLADQ